MYATGDDCWHKASREDNGLAGMIEAFPSQEQGRDSAGTGIAFVGEGDMLGGIGDGEAIILVAGD